MKKHFLRALALIGACGISPIAAAQTYPAKPITMVVPFAAGGPSDVIARIFADHMTRTLGQPVIIENVGGAGGTLGSARVAAAEPDGYTLLAGSMGSHVSAPALYPNLKYDSVRDFEPIGLTAHAPVAVVARKDFPAADLGAFVAHVKANGSKVQQAHGGVGASSHMACLLFNSQLDLKPTSIPYRGTGPAINDLVGGHVDYFCEQVVSVAPMVSTGTIKAYGVTGHGRSPAIPAVPTMTEGGFPQYQMSIWSGVFAPKKTPKAAIDKLADALDKALESPEVQKKIFELGGALPAKEERTPAAFDRFVKAEIARWAPILKAAAEKTN